MSKIDHQLFSAHEHALEKEYESCPECGGALSIKHSKSGSFIGCDHYPNCQYTRALVQHEAIDSQLIDGSECPECQHPLAVKSGRYGIFIGCSNFPDCHHIEKHDQEPEVEQITCPQCHQGHLEHRTNRYGKNFYACNSYPSCKFIVNFKPVNQACPECGFGILVQRKASGNMRLECPKKSCNFKQAQQ